jgi:SAM-dependent methyltransferase
MSLIRPMSTTNYNRVFFDKQAQDGVACASVVVPFLFRVVQPKSVVDFGCGPGAWLRAFKEAGAQRVLGIDGDYVSPESLLISPNEFRAEDLTTDFRIHERFDLSVCLEVGEHLPEFVAPSLVAKLTEAAPIVLFSAAIPGQKGTHHVNERWPTYWRSLFKRHGYHRLDFIRPLIWRNREIPFYYRQNLFLFCSQAAIDQSPVLQEEARQSDGADLELIHQDILAQFGGLPGILRMIPGLAVRGIRRRLYSGKRMAPRKPTH